MGYVGSMNNVCMRTLLYFIENRDEELSAPDIRAKFGLRMGNVAVVLRPLVEREVLAYRQGVGGRAGVFSAGPKLKALGVAC